ncbi:MAG: alpha/beta hydrolase [Leptolyngbya sp. RL_3_1]|nr:alpha/beta hydrolase [Leptolyngbya sp. RL_3_1]
MVGSNLYQGRSLAPDLITGLNFNPKRADRGPFPENYGSSAALNPQSLRIYGFTTWRAALQKVLRPLQKTWAHALGLGAISVLAIAPAATSAERIEFFIGPLEPAILVEDLAAFAQDGTINDSFRLVADNMSAAQRQQLRSFLNWQLDVELITVSQFTYWHLGERLLDRAGQVVQTNRLQNGSRPLRAALIAAAADGDGFTPLEVIQAFPLEVMQLDFALLQQILQDNRRFFAAGQELSGLLRSLGEREAAALPAPASGRPTEAGPYQWQRRTLRFDHPLRGETVPFDLYLPRRGVTRDGTPVVVISHGAASGRGGVYLFGPAFGLPRLCGRGARA